jgi:hypothetical protein
VAPRRLTADRLVRKYFCAQHAGPSEQWKIFPSFFSLARLALSPFDRLARHPFTNTRNPMQHQLRLHSAGDGKYSVTLDGRTLVNNSASPILDAALALKSSGLADDHDLVSVTGADFAFIPTPIHRLLAPRYRTLRSTADYQHALARQSPN